MRINNSSLIPGLLSAIFAATLLSACGGMKVWPFGDDTAERPRGPANATEYNCDKGKRFYLRLPDNAASAWIILPDREFGLAKSGNGVYSNGVSTLTIGTDSATLQLSADNTYTECKIPVPPSKK